MKEHDFTAQVVWTGNQGEGTKSYRSYTRNWSVTTPGKPEIHCSNDPLLGGDPSLHNPEDMLIATVSACHMLWYLHLASAAKIVVTGYVDTPVGTGQSEPDGTGRFIKAVLKPVIEVERGTDLEKADQIHYQIHNHCFIARSVNFPITYEASYREA
ncbi:MAG: OsmC family protein [Pseudomonadota bacterium]